MKEQIRAKLIKENKKSSNNFFSPENPRYEAEDDFVDLERTIQSENVIVQQNFNLTSKLGNVIDLLEVCLLETEKESQQIPVIEEEVEEVSEPEPQPQRLTRPKIRKPVEEKSLHKNTSGKVELEVKDTKPQVKTKTIKKVKVVTRTYEVPTLSYEYADLVSHMPSKVFNLNYPIEKTDDAMNEEMGLIREDDGHGGVTEVRLT